MEQLVQVIKNLGTGRIILIAVVGFIFVTILGFMIGGSGSGNYDVLYSGLDQREASEIVANLEQQNVPYTLDAGGSTIRVPSEQVDRVRLNLAGQGLGGSVIGKEIFDRDSSFGRTTFELNVNLVRAIEGELSRTINEISAVLESRVHIVMPERRPFQREASEPKASILVRTRAGGLGRGQAEAIQALVAAAVPGLSSERVAISDTSGRLLSDGRPSDENGNFGSLEQARISAEQLFRDRIENLLASSLGAQAVRAEVAVTMNRSRTTTSQVEFDPDTQVVRSTTTIEEQLEETDGDPNTVSVSNNVPTNNAGAGGGNESRSESKTDERTDFENSKTETVTTTEPGEITLIRASVLVDHKPTADGEGFEPRTEEELAALRALVESAIPFDADRGDLVTVQTLKFADPEPIPAADPEFNLLGLDVDELVKLVRNGSLFVVMVLFLLIVVRPIVSRIIESIPDAPPPPDPAQLEAAEGAPALTGPVTVDADLIARAAAGDAQAAELVKASQSKGELDLSNLKTDARIDIAQVEGRIQDSVIKKVSDLVENNPDDSAAIIRTWLYADASPT